MSDLIESLREEAKQAFLGRNSVIGVGIAEEEGVNRLVFLLSKNTLQARQVISSWAREHRVDVQFIVSGTIHSLR